MKSINEFIAFRKICLENAETALHSAKALQNSKANHISFHLATLSLEEIGKVVLCWSSYCEYEKTGLKTALLIDDHVKKLFWAVWWPLLGLEIPTQNKIDEYRSMASSIHQKRLESLYTEITDTTAAHEKITDKELAQLISFVEERLQHTLEHQIADKPMSNDIETFMAFSELPENRVFIFGEKAQQKLVEMGDVVGWVKWINNKLESEQKKMSALLQDELSRKVDLDAAESDIPKWEIKIKLKSALHSTRPKILTQYNEKFPNFRLDKGNDNNSLILTLTLFKHVKVDELWHFGFLMSQIYVTALNIATQGVIWWNVPVDLDKFYEHIRDLENKTKIDSRVVSKLHWPEANQILTFENLALATMVNTYIVKNFKKPAYQLFQNYMYAMALLSKNDIHLRFETDMFGIFYRTYKDAIMKFQATAKHENFAELGYQQIAGFLKGRENYDKMILLGESLVNHNTLENQITLTEVLAVKNYLGAYLVTLAARDHSGNDSLLLTAIVATDNGIEQVEN